MLNLKCPLPLRRAAFQVTHEVWPSSLGENILVDDNAAFEFFWEYNEDEDRSDPYKPAIEC